MKKFVVILLPAFIACTSPTKEEVYNKVAQHYCQCISKDGYMNFERNQIECLKLIFTVYKTSLQDVGFDSTKQESITHVYTEIFDKRALINCTGLSDAQAIWIKQSVAKWSDIMQFEGTFEYAESKTGYYQVLKMRYKNDGSVHYFYASPKKLTGIALKNGANVKVSYHFEYFEGTDRNFVDTIHVL